MFRHGSGSRWRSSMCWSSGMAYGPPRRASCPSRSRSLVCNIPMTLLGLSETNTIGYYGQLDLFGEAIRLQRLSNLYESIDTLREKYGKHTVFLGASYLAHTHAQHESERGHLPERQRELLPGETARKRLGIPMFMGEVR